MIELTLTDDLATPHVGRLILAPNHSSTWKNTSYFLLLLLTVSLVVACSFLLLGYWMILPFSIVEVSVVSICFFVLARRARYREVIDFSGEYVTITSGLRGPEQSRQWSRFFTKVVVHKPRYSWYAPTVELRHRDETIEIGHFLNASEKQTLVKHLRQLIALANQRQTATSGH